MVVQDNNLSFTLTIISITINLTDIDRYMDMFSYKYIFTNIHEFVCTNLENNTIHYNCNDNSLVWYLVHVFHC